MKAIINLRKTTAVAAIAMIALTASAQTGPRSSARNNGSEANKARGAKRSTQNRVEIRQEQEKKNTYQYRLSVVSLIILQSPGLRQP